MIQRIQTLFLLGALVLISLCFFVPVAEFSLSDGRLFSFNLNGFKLLEGNAQGVVEKATSLFFAGILICAILFVTIFLYKNRILQIRLCVYGIVLSIGLTFLFFFVLYNIKKNDEATIYYHVTTVLPVIAGILCYLALRAIKKDENLVKSYDRLR